MRDSFMYDACLVRLLATHWTWLATCEPLKWLQTVLYVTHSTFHRSSRWYKHIYHYYVIIINNNKYLHKQTIELFGQTQTLAASWPCTNWSFLCGTITERLLTIMAASRFAYWYRWLRECSYLLCIAVDMWLGLSLRSYFKAPGIDT